MAKFGEEVRSLLEDVARFIHHTLKSVALPTAASSHRQKLIKRLGDFQNEHPQMIWDIDTSGSQDIGPSSNGDGLIYDELEAASKSPTTAHAPPVIRDHKPPHSASNHGQPLQPLMIAASDIKDPAKSGFLTRKSQGLLKAKKKTWCIIKTGVFYGFEKQNSKSQLMSFPLKGSTTKALPVVKGEYSFELGHTEQKYTFSVTESSEFENWLRVIHKESFVVADARMSVAYACTNDVVTNNNNHNVHNATSQSHAPVPGVPSPTSPSVPPSRPVPQQPKPVDPGEPLYDEATPPPPTTQDAPSLSPVVAVVMAAAAGASKPVEYDTPSANSNKTRPVVPAPRAAAEAAGQSDSTGLYDEIPGSGVKPPGMSAVAMVAASNESGSGSGTAAVAAAQQKSAAERPLTYEMVPGDLGGVGAVAAAAAAAAPKAVQVPETRRPPPPNPNHPSPSPVAASEAHPKPQPEKPTADHPKKGARFAPTTTDAGHSPTPAMRTPHATAPPEKRESRPALPVPDGRAEGSSEWYVARWDCTADAANELSFKMGEHLKIISREYEQFGWWVGQMIDSGGKKRVGLVPKDYVEKLVENVNDN